MSVAPSPPDPLVARPIFARPILALDTATSHAVVAVGDGAGRPLAWRTWAAGHRHGDDLLPAIRTVLGQAGLGPDDLGGIVVGTGPGAFTGLRVGLATAKALARALDLPIVGVPTAAALLTAAVPPGPASPATARPEGAPPAFASAPGEGTPVPHPNAVLLPAGPSDRVLVRDGTARLLRGADDGDLPPADALVAVDLEGRAPPDAVARGVAAQLALHGALLAIGARRLAAGDADDLARLVPEYVTLPRGVGAESGEVAWSRGPR